MTWDSARASDVFRNLLGNGTDPVAVFLLAHDLDKDVFGVFERLKNHRYCQALMKARCCVRRSRHVPHPKGLKEAVFLECKSEGLEEEDYRKPRGPVRQKAGCNASHPFDREDAVRRTVGRR